MNEAEPSIPRPDRSSSRFAHRLADAAPWLVFAVLAAVSWNRWIEPYVDSGRELMVPRRLADGERLWAEVRFNHGPLGPYLAALVEKAAGPSLGARTVLCAAVAAAHLFALQVLARRWLSPWRAALTLSVAVSTAFFLRPGGWLFPFSFDVAIAVAALTAAVASATREPVPADAAAGAAVLAALLARPEIGLAGAAVLALSVRRRPRRLIPLALAPVSAAAAAYAVLSVGIPHRTLLVDGWLAFLDPPAAFANVYRAYAGLDRPGLRVLELILSLAVLAVFSTVIAASALGAERLRRSGRRSGAALAEALVIGALAAAAAVAARPPEALAGSLSSLPPLVRAVPLGMVAAAAWRLARSFRSNRPTDAFETVPDAAVWLAAVFAARLLLAASYVGPYPAFFLPLPLLVAQTALFGAADRARASMGAALPRLAAAALLVFACFRGLALWDLCRGRTWGFVATPAGGLSLPEPIAGATTAAIRALEGLPRAKTLAGFPEAGFFTYVLGRRNPFRQEQFFPGHLDDEAERRAVALLRARPPDALLRANVLAIGEGSPAFGRDYDVALDGAARELFQPLFLFGPGARPNARIGDEQFFVEIAVPVSRGSEAAR